MARKRQRRGQGAGARRQRWRAGAQVEGRVQVVCRGTGGWCACGGKSGARHRRCGSIAHARLVHGARARHGGMCRRCQRPPPPLPQTSPR
eukprot:7059120-Prymnesium_polylepis.1